MESSLYTLVNSLKDKVEFQVLVSNTKLARKIEFIDGVRVIRAGRWGEFVFTAALPGDFLFG